MLAVVRITQYTCRAAEDNEEHTVVQTHSTAKTMAPRAAVAALMLPPPFAGFVHASSATHRVSISCAFVFGALPLALLWARL